MSIRDIDRACEGRADVSMTVHMGNLARDRARPRHHKERTSGRAMAWLAAWGGLRSRSLLSTINLDNTPLWRMNRETDADGRPCERPTADTRLSDVIAMRMRPGFVEQVNPLSVSATQHGLHETVRRTRGSNS